MYALVTGASAGIGMEIAKYLSILGYDLILTARSEDKLQDLRKTILKRFPDRTVLVIPADLSKREECFRLYKEACERAGEENIEFVANNAGKGVYGLFLETDLDAELELIDLNVASVHILSKLFLRDMVRRGHGTLMNVGSPGPTDTAFNKNSGVAVSGKQIKSAQVAREGVDGALKGKMIVIPGKKMPAVVRASSLMGEHLSTRLNYRLQVKKAGKQGG